MQHSDGGELTVYARDALGDLESYTSLHDDSPTVFGPIDTDPRRCAVGRGRVTRDGRRRFGNNDGASDGRPLRLEHVIWGEIDDRSKRSVSL